MLESGRLDLDRMAKNRLDLDLIVAVHPRSGGQGVSGAWGRRGSPEQQLPRRRFTGAGQNRPPGGHFERGLAWDDLRTTRDPPER